jgi:hypothetical protein
MDPKFGESFGMIAIRRESHSAGAVDLNVRILQLAIRAAIPSSENVAFSTA